MLMRLEFENENNKCDEEFNCYRLVSLSSAYAQMITPPEMAQPNLIY
jgi:hypothetical protein